MAEGRTPSTSRNQGQDGALRFSTGGFQVGGAGFGVLAGEASYADDGAARADDEDERHLEEDFEGVGDAGGGAIDEALGAIAGLEDELAAVGGFGELVEEAEDFPTGDQGGESAQVGEDPVHLGGVGVVGLL